MSATAEPLTLPSCVFICHHMRDLDREEVFATRAHDSASILATEIFRAQPYGFAICAEGAGPVALMGGLETWPGMWSMFMIATPEFTKARVLATRTADAILKEVKRRGARRMECRSMEGHEEAHRWIEALGGVHEATLRDYGKNGEDFRVYRFEVE